MARFVKGQSGNPGGRRKGEPPLPDIRRLAGLHTPQAIERLAYWMNSNFPNASVTACGMLLERAYGKAPQAHTDANGNNLTLRMVITGVVREVDHEGQDGNRGNVRTNLPQLQSPHTISPLPSAD